MKKVLIVVLVILTYVPIVYVWFDSKESVDLVTCKD